MRERLGETYFYEGARRAQSHVNVLINENYNLNNVQVELLSLSKMTLTQWNTSIEHLLGFPWKFICFGFVFLVHCRFLDFVNEIHG